MIRHVVRTLRSVPDQFDTARRWCFKQTDDSLAAYRRYVSLGRRVCPRWFTDADPFALYWVDPQSIGHLHRTTPTRRWGRVRGGVWDLKAPDFTESDVYRDVVAHFHHGIPWSETRRFQKKREYIERGATAKGCATVTELHARYAAVDDIYNAMKQDGYRTQDELQRENPDRYTRLFYKNAILSPLLDEIVVDIGRDGRLIHRHHGRHRLSIAKLLGLASVPVLVNIRHRKWQRVRDYTRGIPDEGALSPAERKHLDHPDLQDIRPGPSQQTHRVKPL